MLVAEAMSASTTVAFEFQRPGSDLFAATTIRPEAPAVYAKGNRFFNNILLNCAAYNTPNGVYGRGCLNIGRQDSMLIYNNGMQQTSAPTAQRVPDPASQRWLPEKT